MRIYTIIFFLAAALTTALAQENEGAARQRYIEAEDAYFRSHYNEALILLQRAEKSLGKTNPKIQLLKVLVYEKLVGLAVDYYDDAMKAIDEYLNMERQLPPLHRKYLPLVKAIRNQLPAVKREIEERNWNTQARERRPGILLSVPGKHTVGVDYGITIGDRSSFWAFQISRYAEKYLEDDYFFKITGRLEDMPYKAKIKRTFLSVGYFQGVRILPKARDFVKPFVGLRVIYGGDYFLSYKSPQEGYPDPEEQAILNFKAAGVDPGVYYLAVTNFTEKVYVDVVAGLMFHYKRLSLTAGKDFASTKMTHLGLSVRLN